MELDFDNYEGLTFAELDQALTTLEGLDLQQLGFTEMEAEGIRKSLGKAWNSTKNMAKKAGNAVKNAGNKAIQGAKNLGNKVVKGAKDLGNKVVSGTKKGMAYMKKEAKELEDKMEEGLEWLGHEADATLDAVANTLKKAGSKLAAFVSDPKVQQCMK